MGKVLMILVVCIISFQCGGMEDDISFEPQGNCVVQDGIWEVNGVVTSTSGVCPYDHVGDVIIDKFYYEEKECGVYRDVFVDYIDNNCVIQTMRVKSFQETRATGLINIYLICDDIIECEVNQRLKYTLIEN